MSVAGAALIGAGILALAALLMSCRSPRAPAADPVAAFLKAVVAAGIAAGCWLIAFSVARASQVFPDWAVMLVLLAVPVGLVVVSRIGEARQAGTKSRRMIGRAMGFLRRGRTELDQLG